VISARRANAGYESLIHSEITPPFFHHFRYGTLGGHVEQCEDCHEIRIAYNSCRNRHCPKCQGLARAQWLADRQAELLPVPYFHVVFTMPAPIAAIALQNKAIVYDIVQGDGRDGAHHRRRSQASGSRDRHDRGAAHLGTEPSLLPSFPG
jgi:Transposase zinc-binding domain